MLNDPLGLFGLDNIFGAAKALGGGAEVLAGGTLFAAGAATSEIGVGIAGLAGGAIVVAHGADTFQAGIRQAWNGSPTDTLTSKGLQAVGMSKTGANLTDAGIGIVFSFGASAGSGAIRTSEGLVHLTSALIARSSELIGNNYAGPASNALREGWSVTAATGLNPGKYASVPIPAVAESAFTSVKGIGPLSTWQASMGQVYTASGTLNLATGAFAKTGVNVGQMAIYGLDSLFTGSRILGALK